MKINKKMMEQERWTGYSLAISIKADTIQNEFKFPGSVVSMKFQS